MHTVVFRGLQRHGSVSDLVISDSFHRFKTCRDVKVKLEDLRQRHDALLSEKEAARTQSQQEVDRLTRRLSEVGKEHNDTKARLESTQQELTTTVQLSELALAAKSCTGEGRRSEDENRRIAAAQQRMEELVRRWLVSVVCNLKRLFDERQDEPTCAIVLSRDSGS